MADRAGAEGGIGGRSVILEADLAANFGLVGILPAESDVAEVEGVVGCTACADVLHAEAIELASVIPVHYADKEFDPVVHQQAFDDHPVIIAGVDGEGDIFVDAVGVGAVCTSPGADQGVAEPYLNGDDGLRGAADDAIVVSRAQFARVVGEDLGADPVLGVAPGLHQGEAAARAFHALVEVDVGQVISAGLGRCGLPLDEVDHYAVADDDRLAVAADGEVAGVDGVATQLKTGEQQLDARGGIGHRVPEVLSGGGGGEVVEGDVLDGIDEHQPGQIHRLVIGVATSGMVDRLVLNYGDVGTTRIGGRRGDRLQMQGEGDALARLAIVGVTEDGGVVEPDQGDGVIAGGRGQGRKLAVQQRVAAITVEAVEQPEFQHRIGAFDKGEDLVARRADGGARCAQAVEGGEQGADAAQQYVVVVVVFGGSGDIAGL
ncbi:hypothetical protein D3C84_496520 [compost metagenome]